MPAQAPSKSRFKTPPPAPGLNRLGTVKTNAAPGKKTAGTLGVVELPGDDVKKFNEAKRAMAEAEVTIKEIGPRIQAAGLEAIFQHNCSPDTLEPIKSVKVQGMEVDPENPKGDPIPGAICRVSFTSKYNNCDAGQVDATFAAFEPVGDPPMPRDINDYVVETVAAKFDDTIWLNPDGSFNKAIYDKFRIAIERVANELGIKDELQKVRNPLMTSRKVIVKPDFHEKRFLEFNPDENKVLTEVLPNTVQLVPVVK